jgi:hypothetical protein
MVDCFREVRRSMHGTRRSTRHNTYQPGTRRNLHTIGTRQPDPLPRTTHPRPPKVFNALPLAMCLNGRVLVLHGGLFSQDGVTLDDIRKVDRFK